MPVMIKFDVEEFKNIQKAFPNLFYEQKGNCIKGELDFGFRYEKRSGKKGKNNWIIVPCSSGSDCLQDCYEIEIRLSHNRTGWPKVFETGGRIKRLAKEIRKPIIDLHIYPHDNSCCLGICVNPNITLYDFIIREVCPYFVWQAYFDKYRKLPPCGEYSHDKKGMQECLQDLKKIGRNDSCICGSGKKYKKCCLFRRKEIESLLKERANEMEKK